MISRNVASRRSGGEGRKRVMDSKTIAGYIAAAAAIAFGAALIWFAPAALSKDAALGLGIAFVTGGFSGLGVAIVAPSAIASAKTAAVAEADARRARAG